MAALQGLRLRAEKPADCANKRIETEPSQAGFARLLGGSCATFGGSK
jgi:hypothetical protein